MQRDDENRQDKGEHRIERRTKHHHGDGRQCGGNERSKRRHAPRRSNREPGRQRNQPDGQASASITPKNVATPLPPRKRSHTGKT